jgi:hypothetical protein
VPAPDALRDGDEVGEQGVSRLRQAAAPLHDSDFLEQVGPQDERVLLPFQPREQIVA